MRSEPTAGVAPPQSSALDRVAAHYNRAVSAQIGGDLDGAIRGYREVLEQTPGHVDARYNLAIALATQGKLDEAAANYRGVLDRRPQFAEARSNLGLLLHAQGKLDGAIDCYWEALAVKPNAWVYNNLGNAQDEMGKVDDAVSSYRRALELADARAIQVNFARCVKHLDARHADPALRALVAQAIGEAWTRPSDLASVAVELIRTDRIVDDCIERASRAWPTRLRASQLFGAHGFEAVSRDSLLLSLLHNAPVCDLSIERFLTMARRTMLDLATSATDGDDPDLSAQAFYCAVARQCFLNEYVFACDEAEAAQAAALRHALIYAQQTDARIPPLWIAAVGAYTPLSDLPLAAGLVERPWSESIGALLTQQIVEPAEENRYRETIDRMTAIDDVVSLRVQRQYEENPYPRWTRFPVADQAQPLNAYLRQQVPRGEFEPIANDRTVDVLIAGCGTGQEAIETARQIAGSRVLAVDLSATSLAYATRKTMEAGIGNVEYAQADILKLEPTAKTFDMIASVGVLHHLADPTTGWRALVALLRPGGFMRIGLYSERARRDVVAARAFIAERGYAPTAAAIRSARQDLVSVPSDPLSRVALLRDFYTTSECRDLLFHVQEHRLTLPAIQAMLAALGLRFIGFVLEPRVVRRYRTHFPHDRALADFGAWDDFETRFPDTFTGMYRFWVQKA
ncbi:MAG TPA: tetratricopeptide repeat protein [Casimicrobiaceae bacterium]